MMRIQLKGVAGTLVFFLLEFHHRIRLDSGYLRLVSTHCALLSLDIHHEPYPETRVRPQRRPYCNGEGDES